MASHRKVLVAVAVPVGFLLSGVLIWQASYAAFTATTSNTGNTWQAGTVVLTDNDSDSALFTATGLVPGSTGERCITVSYTGTASTSVKMYANYNASDPTSPLAPYLLMTVTPGTGTDPACADFAASGAAVYTSIAASSIVTAAHDWSTGVDTQPATTGWARTYHVQYQLDPATPDGSQGDSAAIDFQWEARTP